MTSGEAGLQEIGWNGVRFNTPADWEIGKTGKRYLLFGNTHGPVMEIKWGRVRGKFSSRKQFKRLCDAQGRAVAGMLKQTPLPESWESMLHPFEATGFSWSHPTSGGYGAVLRCPECRNVTLIQFFRGRQKMAENRIERVLASYRDHPDGNRVLWSIFDIRVLLPAQFKLIHYRFDAGAFELGFAAKGIRAYLYRWGPAAFLLQKQDLESFAGRTLPLPKSNPHQFTINDDEVMEWAAPEAVSIYHKTLGRLCLKFPFQRTRVWRVSEKNRLLGIRLLSRKPLDSGWFERICGKYVAV